MNGKLLGTESIISSGKIRDIYMMFYFVGPDQSGKSGSQKAAGTGQNPTKAKILKICPGKIGRWQIFLKFGHTKICPRQNVADNIGQRHCLSAQFPTLVRMLTNFDSGSRTRLVIKIHFDRLETTEIFNFW